MYPRDVRYLVPMIVGCRSVLVIRGYGEFTSKAGWSTLPRALSLTHSRTHSRIHAFTHSRTHTLAHSRTHALTHLLLHSLNHSLNHSLTHAGPGRPDGLCAVGTAASQAGPTGSAQLWRGGQYPSSLSAGVNEINDDIIFGHFAHFLSSTPPHPAVSMPSACGVQCTMLCIWAW